MHEAYARALRVWWPSYGEVRRPTAVRPWWCAELAGEGT